MRKRIITVLKPVCYSTVLLGVVIGVAPPVLAR